RRIWIWTSSKSVGQKNRRDDLLSKLAAYRRICKTFRGRRSRGREIEIQGRKVKRFKLPSFLCKTGMAKSLRCNSRGFNELYFKHLFGFCPFFGCWGNNSYR